MRHGRESRREQVAEPAGRPPVSPFVRLDPLGDLVAQVSGDMGDGGERRWGFEVELGEGPSYPPETAQQVVAGLAQEAGEIPCPIGVDGHVAGGGQALVLPPRAG